MKTRENKETKHQTYVLFMASIIISHQLKDRCWQTILKHMTYMLLTRKLFQILWQKQVKNRRIENNKQRKYYSCKEEMTISMSNKLRLQNKENDQTQRGTLYSNKKVNPPRKQNDSKRVFLNNRNAKYVKQKQIELNG